MVRLKWDDPSHKTYEYGVDRGVFFPLDGLTEMHGVPWNGITDINISYFGGEITPVYLDGEKIIQNISNRSLKLSISAYSKPKELEEAEGIRPLITGVYATKQRKSRFGLSYRTKVGDEIGYQIHFLYNATISSSSAEYSTETNATDPILFKWDVDTSPYEDNIFNTSHYIIKSNKISTTDLENIENYLYGVDGGADSRLPSIETLITLIGM